MRNPVQAPSPTRVACLAALALLLLLPSPGAPQAPTPPAEPGLGEAAACAPVLVYEEPRQPLRLIGTTDPVERLSYGPDQTLIISAGVGAGLAPGQTYYVRRLSRQFGARRPDRGHPVAVRTAGWIRIVSVQTSYSEATIVRACDDMQPGDYLEPFVPLQVPIRETAGSLRFEDLATVIGGDEGRTAGAENDAMIVDRGSDHGIAPGDQFVVLRAKSDPSAPLVQIGQGVVLLAGPQMSTVRITSSRDAVFAGDLVAFRR